MEAKRKANGASDAEDRNAKRRRTVQDFDLSKGETRDSTTAYGLAFLEQIRRTADKSGRLVATAFEKLVPRASNPEYYKRTRLPISLETIEEKLLAGEFKSLAELESYFKRMIANAKDFYSRGTQVFDDAERVRKALSNYMTKTNPAYSNRSYQAMPTPLPPENPDEEEDEEDEEEEGEEDAEGEDADEEEDAEGEEEDAEGEEEPEEDEEPRSRRKAIILKRRGPSRTRRSSNHESARARSPPPSRPDHQYENVPYRGLTFQQAQEKIVEELLRHQEPEYDDAYFEPFINLPPRALKDYYKVITDPLSIKKLQKMVKGVHGRGDASGVSDFKTWSAFEEKTKLLWTNAYFYNEEGSDIYVLAQELEKFFYSHLKKAQAAVSEPSQPKIKLKVGQGSETPSSSKKITIHVGGRDSSVASPAPLTTQSSEANGTANVNGSAQLAASLEAPRSVSASAPSPTPSSQVGLKVEDGIRASPAVANMPPGTPGQAAPRPPIPAVPSQPFQTNPLGNGYADQRRFRPAGKGIDSALIEKLRIQTHPSIPHERPTLLTVLPNAKEMQQSATINLPHTQTRIWIVVTLPTFLQDRQYSLWTLVDKQPWKQLMQPIPNQTHYERVFDVMLHPGLNVIETHLIAAIPRHEREPGGPEVELEVFTVLINVSRPY